MSKSKPESGKSASRSAAQAASWGHTFRETVESVVIAFILAFLFRTFEAEAFVIPTGSMAPTLQGRHKDVECAKCHYRYRAGASSEVDSRTGERLKECNVTDTTCPMCGYTEDVNPADDNNASKYPSYDGDRIIVNKFAYDLSPPQRWDVVVFKYPDDAKINYIKRLVGLPNERLQVRNGDIYTAPLKTNDFQIARKPPEKLRAVLQPVYDNDYIAPELIKAGIGPRWQPWVAAGQASPWKTSDDFESFEIDGGAAAPAWIRYQHLKPSYDTWKQVLENQRVRPVAPSLITDDYAYNDEGSTCQRRKGTQVAVGDLAVEAQLDVKNNKGAVIFELIKGGRQFRCRIELSNGAAQLSISGLADFAPKASAKISGPGEYHVMFSNVDQELLLWVNGELAKFDAPTTYPDLNNSEPVRTPPTPGVDQATDLSPVGIAVEGGAKVAVSHVKIWRDIFYRAQGDDWWIPKFVKEDGISNVVELQPNQFFMMGDNSPESADSRVWGKVDRELLIGKALFIYWPHSWWPSWALSIPIKDFEIKFPFWPNFKQMKLVR